MRKNTPDRGRNRYRNLETCSRNRELCAWSTRKSIETGVHLAGPIKELNNVAHEPNSGEIPDENAICHSQLLHECLLFILANFFQ